MSRGGELSVGFLHLGGQTHGINRYGHVIADALRNVPGITVVETSADMTGTGWRGITQAVRAVREFPRADVVLVPFSRNGLWSRDDTRLLQLAIVHRGLRAETVSVMHDVYSPGGRRRPDWRATALATSLPNGLVIHGEHERQALARLPRASRAIVIPHFIEEQVLPARAASRRSLGLTETDRVIAVIGWIHPRKNYEFAVQVLASLGTEYRMWFVGGSASSASSYLDRVAGLARELGVDDRLDITGYVSDGEMGQRLAALDVGLCPYLDASASGSLSTLLSARRPVVSHDFALAREISQLAPRTMTILAELSPQPWSQAIAAAAVIPASPDPYRSILAARSPAATAERYAEAVRRIASA